MTRRSAASAARGRPQPARWPLVAIAVLAVAAAVPGAVQLWRSRPRPPVDRWAGVPRADGPPVQQVRALDRVRVTYRLDGGDPLGSSRSEEVLSVERPFTSVAVVSSGGRRTSARASAVGRLRLVTAGQPDAVLGQPLDLAGSDLRLDVHRRRLEERGLLQVRERRTVQGRPCQVLRSGVPPQGTLPLVPPTEVDHVDTCVDDAGLVLAQVHVVAGGVATRRVATRVEEGAALPSEATTLADPAAAPTVPIDRGGAEVRRVDATTFPPGRWWALDQPPAGFRYEGRFAVVGATTTNVDGAQTGSRLASFTDAWVRGPDLLVVDQGGTTGGTPPFGADPHGSPVELGPLGAGEAVDTARLATVRASLGGGRYVKVSGTLPVDQLAEVARSLRAEERPAT